MKTKGTTKGKPHVGRRAEGSKPRYCGTTVYMTNQEAGILRQAATVVANLVENIVRCARSEWLLATPWSLVKKDLAYLEELSQQMKKVEESKKKPATAWIVSAGAK